MGPMSVQEMVGRLNLKKVVDDELTLAYLTFKCGQYLTSGSGGRKVIGQELLQNPQALFWYIRLQFRETRRTAVGMKALRFARGEDVALEMLTFSNSSHDENPAGPPFSAYGVNAECGELEGVQDIAYLVSDHCVLLNLASNNLEEANLVANKSMLQNSPLSVLSLGGNSFTNCTTVCSCSPSTLLSLDLSFTEGLQFPPNCFQSQFQLMRLVLDGCGITSTVLTAPGFDNVSIFKHLYCLEELSLKENELEGVPALRGLFYFSFSDMEALQSDISLSAFGALELGPRLRHVWVADNPICEVSSVLSQVVGMLSKSISSLHMVDEQRVGAAPASSASAMSDASVRSRLLASRAEAGRYGDALAGALGGPSGLDNMEREFLAALKGEKDNSVVS